MITADELQNSLLLIDHHVEDALEALANGEDDIVDASMRDIKEVTEELRSYLPQKYASALEDAEAPNDQDVADIADIADGLGEI